MPAIDIEHRTDSTGVRRISVCREDAEREGSARTRTDSTPIRTPPAAWAHCSSSDLAAEGQSSEVGGRRPSGDLPARLAKPINEALWNDPDRKYSSKEEEGIEQWAHVTELRSEALAEHVMANYAPAEAAIVKSASVEDVDPDPDRRAGWTMDIDLDIANPVLFAPMSATDRMSPSPATQSDKRVLESWVHRVAMTGRLRVSEERAVDLIRAAGIGTIPITLSAPLEERDPGIAHAMF
jgi:hypothetical protein